MYTYYFDNLPQRPFDFEQADSQSTQTILLDKLGLKQYFPAKLSTQQVTAIDASGMYLQDPIDDKERPLFVARKTLALNYTGRDYEISKHTATVEAVNTGIETESANVSIFDLVIDQMHDLTLSESSPSSNTNTGPNCETFSSADIMLALLLCCDNILIQQLIAKLSACQYAIPYLLSTPCKSLIMPLWSMRSVKKQWHTLEKSTKECNVVEAPVPVVAFIELGSLTGILKSTILNNTLTAGEFSSFSREECKSDFKTHLGECAADISWYLPSGRKDDLFPEIVAFLNLRGNALEKPHALNFIKKVAQILVIITSDKTSEVMLELQKIDKLNMPFVWMKADVKGNAQSGGCKCIIPCNAKDPVDMGKELRENVKGLLSFVKKEHVRSIEQHAELARGYEIQLDEDQTDIVTAKHYAKQVVSLIVQKMEDNFPLQGEQWLEWCKLDKEKARLHCYSGENGIPLYKSELESQMLSIHNGQRSDAIQLLQTNSLIRTFLHVCLTSTYGNIQNYFMVWLKYFLEKDSIEKLTTLRKQYDDIWKKLTQQQLLHVDKDAIKVTEKALQHIGTQMENVTIGLEHFVREMGQIYQCCSGKVDGKLAAIVTLLPEMAANMLIAGHPLELMDGKAGYVPVQWITAVLSSVSKKLQNPRLLVLSILGLQSSGKSTLLNAMFGIQFSVSAGRCTQGAFIQLIPVESSLSDKLGYEYVLIIDSEGLRSPEGEAKQRPQHDNEIATFIIGMADLTLVNIYGENPVDIDDLLQIAVLAFMRMKQVQLNPRCYFVHQNVADITASDKTMVARRNLQEKLNDITTVAAEEELCELSVTNFNDVIEFDINEHVWYFPGLWKGSPPMAPPNPDYSTGANGLKQALLNSNQGKSCQTVNDITSRINDLWSALVNENFVFSFRNSVEVSAYRKLEKMFLNWKLELQIAMWEWQRSAAIEIGDADKLTTALTSQIMTSLTKCADEKLKDIFSKIENYQDNSTHESDATASWYDDIRAKLMNTKKELLVEYKRKCEALLKSKQARINIDSAMPDHQKRVSAFIAKLVSSVKFRDDSVATLQAIFEPHWNTFLSEILPDARNGDTLDIEKDFETHCHDKYKHQRTMLSSSSANETEQFLIEPKRHLQGHVKTGFRGTILTFFSQNKPIIQDSDIYAAQNVYTAALSAVDNYIQEKERAQEDYNPTFISDMVNIVEDTVKSSSVAKTLKLEFRTDLVIFIHHRTKKRFEILHKNIMSKNDPRAFLNQQKPEVFRQFCEKYRGRASDEIAARLLTNMLKPAIQESIFESTAIALTTELRLHVDSLSGNRSQLEVYVMKWLMHKKSFPDFVKFIQTPKHSVSEFIEHEISTSLFGGKGMKSRLQRQLDLQTENYRRVLDQCISETECKFGHINKMRGWLKMFSKNLGKSNVSVSLPWNDLESVETQSVDNLVSFTKTLCSHISVMFDEMKLKYSNLTPEDLKRWKMSPYELLLKQWSGCWEKCPFCSAVCTNTLDGHSGDHNLDFHRPCAVRGTQWYQTTHFVIETCSANMQSEYSFQHGDGFIKFKRYRTAGKPYSDWKLVPGDNLQSYWKWFLCHFKSDLERYYSYQFDGLGEIPKEWFSITESNVMEELELSLRY